MIKSRFLGLLALTAIFFSCFQSRSIYGGLVTTENQITLCVDYRQMGIEDDNTWGGKSHAGYNRFLRNYDYSFRILPFNEKATDLI